MAGSHREVGGGGGVFCFLLNSTHIAELTFPAVAALPFFPKERCHKGQGGHSHDSNRPSTLEILPF